MKYLGKFPHKLWVKVNKRERRQTEIYLLQNINKTEEILAKRARLEAKFSKDLEELRKERESLVLILKDLLIYKKIEVDEYLNIEANEVWFLDPSTSEKLGSRTVTLLDYAGVENETEEHKSQ